MQNWILLAIDTLSETLIQSLSFLMMNFITYINLRIANNFDWFYEFFYRSEEISYSLKPHFSEFMEMSPVYLWKNLVAAQ